MAELLSNICFFFSQELHLDQFKKYTQQIGQKGEADLQRENKREMKSTSAANLSIFRNYFRVVSEKGDKLEVVCRFCAEPKPITVYRRILTNVVRHLAVCFP